MSIKTTHSDNAVYAYGSFRDFYGARICLLFRKEGMIEIYIDNGTQDDANQYIAFEAIVNGRARRMTQHRTPCDRITETGAMRIATKWLKSLVGGA